MGDTELNDLVRRLRAIGSISANWSAVPEAKVRRACREAADEIERLLAEGGGSGAQVPRPIEKGQPSPSPSEDVRVRLDRAIKDMAASVGKPNTIASLQVHAHWLTQEVVGGPMGSTSGSACICFTPGKRNPWCRAHERMQEGASDTGEQVRSGAQVPRPIDPKPAPPSALEIAAYLKGSEVMRRATWDKASEMLKRYQDRADKAGAASVITDMLEEIKRWKGPPLPSQEGASDTGEQT